MGSERATGVLRGVRGTRSAARARGLMRSLNLGGHVRRRRGRRAGEPPPPSWPPSARKACRSWCRTRCTARGSSLIDDASDIEDAVRGCGRKAPTACLWACPTWPRSLCFADCVPVVAVSPTGRFAVAHAGWRGAVAAYRVPGRARARPARRAGRGQGMRAVRGPAARRGGCLQRVRRPTHPCRMLRLRSRRVRPVRRGLRRRRRAEAGGTWTCPRPSSGDVERAGVDGARVCDAGACTACDTTGRWYSYRASGGVCGRHGAIAFARNEVGPYGN